MTLSCMEPNNYAAVAKQLHKTAVEAEQRIYDLEYLLRAAANRPTVIQRTDVLQTGFSSGFEQSIGTSVGFSFVSLFNNTKLESDEALSGNSEVFDVLGDGVYEVGLTGNVVASGIVDVNSYRILCILQFTPDPLDTNPLLSGYRLVDHACNTLFESNVGIGMDFSLAAEFRIRAGDIMLFTLLHNNTSSTMNLTIGSLGWIHRISDAHVTAVL